MTTDELGIEQSILAIDVGATYTKTTLVADDGELLGEVQREPTPYPCTPEVLVDALVAAMNEYDRRRVAVGFPGEFVDGLVVEPGNLSRSGGITTDIDPAVHARWRGYNLQDRLCEASRRDVRVVNDAALAALGCSAGRGREFVVTLGTGFGIALVVDGAIERIRDVGAEDYRDGRTYDELLGEPARRADEQRWNELLVDAVTSLALEFRADTVHLGGGNARRVETRLFDEVGQSVVINDNDAPLRGAARLFRN